MATHQRIYLGVYLQIPYRTLETTSQRRVCPNVSGCDVARAPGRYAKRLVKVNFCPTCGSPIEEATVFGARQVAYRGSEFEEAHEDLFAIVDGHALADGDPEIQKYQFLLPNEDRAQLYEGWGDSDKGVFPYGGDEQHKDLVKFGEVYGQYWAELSTLWPDIKIRQGLVLYHL